MTSLVDTTPQQPSYNRFLGCQQYRYYIGTKEHVPIILVTGHLGTCDTYIYIYVHIYIYTYIRVFILIQISAAREHTGVHIGIYVFI